MENKNTNQSPSPVFCFSKQLDNSSTLDCSVTMIPLHKLGHCGYTFTVNLRRGTNTETVTLENVTSDREAVEQLFDHICTNKIPPSRLSEAVTAFLSNG